MKLENRVILASSSDFRRQQLKQLLLDFTCVDPDIDEHRHHDENIPKMVERLSIAKAEAVKTKHPQAIIIGSDQSASLNGTGLGKPLSEEIAIEQLKMSSGKTVTFHTGLCVLAANGERKTSTIDTEVTFRELNEQQITSYVNKERPLYCAGSFKCEGLGIALFKSIKSDDPSALIGLPLIALSHHLYQLGVDVLI